MKFKMNLFKKTFVYSMTVVFMTLFISFIFNLFFLDSFYINRKKQQIPHIIQNLNSFYDEPFKRDEYVKSLREKEAITVLFMKPDKKSWENYFGGFGNGFDIESLNDREFSIKEQRTTGARILVYDEKLPNGTWVSLRTSLSAIETYKKEVYLFNLFTGIFAILIAGILARYFSRKTAGKIEILNHRAKEIAELKFKSSEVIKSNDELGELNTSIEIMACNLKTSIRNISSFVSNASHELKTPIAVINSHAQRLADWDALSESEKKRHSAVILKESVYMEKLVSSLLLLSKTSSLDYSLRKEYFNLNEIIEESLEKYDFLELSKDIEVVNELKTTDLYADRNLMIIAMNNIIQNGLKYSPVEGIFHIYADENKLFFVNDAQVPSIKKTEELWEPFSRGENTENIEGTGLGLSIIKNILKLNGFEHGISIENSKFKIWFSMEN